MDVAGLVKASCRGPSCVAYHVRVRRLRHRLPKATRCGVEAILAAARMNVVPLARRPMSSPYDMRRMASAAIERACERGADSFQYFRLDARSRLRDGVFRYKSRQAGRTIACVLSFLAVCLHTLHLPAPPLLHNARRSSPAQDRQGHRIQGQWESVSRMPSLRMRTASRIR